MSACSSFWSCCVSISLRRIVGGSFLIGLTFCCLGLSRSACMTFACRGVSESFCSFRFAVASFILEFCCCFGPAAVAIRSLIGAVFPAFVHSACLKCRARIVRVHNEAGSVYDWLMLAPVSCCGCCRLGPCHELGSMVDALVLPPAKPCGSDSVPRPGSVSPWSTCVTGERAGWPHQARGFPRRCGRPPRWRVFPSCLFLGPLSRGPVSPSLACGGGEGRG